MRDIITVIANDRIFNIEITGKRNLTIEYFEWYIARKIFKNKYYTDMQSRKVRCESIKDIVKIYTPGKGKERANPNLTLRDILGYSATSINIHIMTEQEFKAQKC